MKHIFAVVIIALSVACTPQQPTEQEDIPTASPGIPREPATYSSDVTLSIGQTGEATEGVEITFEKILSDSRCPAEVQCIWAGEARALVEVVYGDWSQASALRLMQTDTVEDADQMIRVEGTPWVVTFTTLVPTPTEGVEILPQQYKGTFVVSKKE